MQFDADEGFHAVTLPTGELPRVSPDVTGGPPRPRRPLRSRRVSPPRASRRCEVEQHSFAALGQSFVRYVCARGEGLPAHAASARYRIPG